jgi:hypothetical protein
MAGELGAGSWERRKQGRCGGGHRRRDVGKNAGLRFSLPASCTRYTLSSERSPLPAIRCLLSAVNHSAVSPIKQGV